MQFSVRTFLAALGIALLVTPSVRATTVAPPTFEEIADQSDRVVRATIVSTEPFTKLHEGREIIYTRVSLKVSEVIAGPAAETLELTVLGGRFGDRELRVEGVPEFRVGAEEIFFVKDNGAAYYPIYGVAHGRYPVRKDKATGREYLTRSNGVPFVDTAEVATPLTEGGIAQVQARARSASDAMTPADLAQKVRERRQNPNGATQRAH